MTPKKKALELVSKFCNEAYKYRHCTPLSYDKACALIAVDEVIKELNLPNLRFETIIRRNYWEQVKTEIEKL